jgi:hypothetical protein
MIVLTLHSIVRWLVVIVGIVAMVKLALGWFGKKPFTRADNSLTMLFSMSLDIQVLIGLITLVILSIQAGFERIFAEHAFIMILALVAVHLPMRWRKAADDVRFRNTFLSFVVALVLIFVGVAMVGGWSRVVAELLMSLS